MKPSSYRVAFIHPTTGRVSTFFISELFSENLETKPYKVGGWYIHFLSSGRCALSAWFFSTFSGKLAKSGLLPETPEEALSWLKEFTDHHKLIQLEDL